MEHDGGKKKKRGERKDEEPEKQFDFFLTKISLVPVGVGDRY